MSAIENYMKLANGYFYLSLHSAFFSVCVGHNFHPWVLQPVHWLHHLAGTDKKLLIIILKSSSQAFTRVGIFAFSFYVSVTFISIEEKTIYKLGFLQFTQLVAFYSAKTDGEHQMILVWLVHFRQAWPAINVGENSRVDKKHARAVTNLYSFEIQASIILLIWMYCGVSAGSIITQIWF